MTTTLSKKRHLVLPQNVCAVAGVDAGDEFEISASSGLIVLRKQEPITADEVRAIKAAGRKLPRETRATTAEVAAVIRETRARRRP